MTRADASPHTVARAADLLDNARAAGSTPNAIEKIVEEHAPLTGWPPDLARKYLGQMLRYPVGPRQLAAIERYWQHAHELDLFTHLRPLDTPALRA